MRFPFRLVHGFEDVQRNFEFLEQSGIYWGAGAPTLQAKMGSFYLRADTPSTANQRIYVNTADGSNWTGIV